MAESSIFATFLAAVKFTGRRRICERIFAGTRGSGHLYATGCSAGKDSPVLTNYNGIGELIRAKSDLLARNAASGL